MKVLSLSFGLLIFISISAFAETDPKLAGLCLNEPDLSKLSSDLLKLRNHFLNDDSPTLGIYAPYALRDGMLQCIVSVQTISQNVIDACNSENLLVCGSYQFQDLTHLVVRCYQPFQLDRLAQLPEVIGIIPEPYALSNAGDVQNEADLSIHAEQVRELYGLDGSGVRIGVLSDSIADRASQGRTVDNFILGTSSQARKELPKKIRYIDLGDGSGDDEGAAMMELIHDLAPGADLSFASVRYDYSVFPQNIQKLVSDPGYECNILVDDIHFLKEPLYQNGPIALAAIDAVNSGVPYFASAGNYDKNAHERSFTDVSPEADNAYPPNGKDFHDFGVAYGMPSDTHLTFHLPRYSSIIATLHWDEPYGGVLASGPGAQSDLDLYLVSDTNLPLREGNGGNVLASSVDIQGSEGAPQGEPVEFLYYTNLNDDLDVHIVIDHQNGRIPQKLHLFVVYDDDDGRTIVDRSLLNDRSLMGHMVAPEVTTVAAMPIREINSNGENIEPIEELNAAEYSAEGGYLPILFSDDGQTRLETPLFAAKPDLTGPDKTSTSVEGFGEFSGTSAAAANIAAVAALVLQQEPTLSANQLVDVMRTTAIDAGSEGWDSQTGSGLVDALKILEYLLPTSISDWKKY